MPEFAFPIRVYWEDTDAGGIVYYANYLKFFERARTEWLRQIGVQQGALREQAGGMFVVAEASLKYHQPARLDDELAVTVQIQDSGRAALTLAQQAWRGPRLLCEGIVRIGWVDAASMKPARIPPVVMEKIR
jgi:acyl-CoA thioester hydrolase